MLPLRTLGKSNLKASPVGLGCWQFSLGRGLAGRYWPILAADEIQGIIQASLAGGINWFDTAEVYGWGASERMLTTHLKNLQIPPETVLIATKWWPAFRTADSITKTIDQRLTALNGYPIALYQVHQPFSFSSTAAEMRAMSRLVNAGKIQYVGVSNFSAKKMEKAHLILNKYGLNLISNQVAYSLLNRRIETNGILAMAKEFGISIIAYSPLAQGILSGKFHAEPDLIQKRSGYRKYLTAFKVRSLKKSRPVIETLKKLAEKYQVTAAQVALNWLLQFQGERVVVIPGATSVAQACSNTEAMKFTLTQEELDLLDDVSRRFK